MRRHVAADEATGYRCHMWRGPTWGLGTVISRIMLGRTEEHPMNRMEYSDKVRIDDHEVSLQPSV